jgi:hypothetical protein
MTSEEAIKAIKVNYPPENYTILREALDLAIKLLEKEANRPTEKDMFDSMG